jgi:hypothetical protein
LFPEIPLLPKRGGEMRSAGCLTIVEQTNDFR